MTPTRQAFISATAIASGPQVIAWTEANAIALCAWQLAEAGPSAPGHARWNPWDTTLYVPGAWPYNTFGAGEHVWNYPTEQDGIFAFLATLHQAWVASYGPIRQALAAGTDPYDVERAVASSVWGTEPFASIVAQVAANPTEYLEQPLPNAA